jgi:hypothetical protein
MLTENMEIIMEEAIQFLNGEVQSKILKFTENK